MPWLSAQVGGNPHVASLTHPSPGGARPRSGPDPTPVRPRVRSGFPTPVGKGFPARAGSGSPTPPLPESWASPRAPSGSGLHTAELRRSPVAPQMAGGRGEGWASLPGASPRAPSGGSLHTAELRRDPGPRRWPVAATPGPLPPARHPPPAGYRGAEAATDPGGRGLAAGVGRGGRQPWAMLSSCSTAGRRAHRSPPGGVWSLGSAARASRSPASAAAWTMSLAA